MHIPDDEVLGEAAAAAAADVLIPSFPGVLAARAADALALLWQLQSFTSVPINWYLSTIITRHRYNTNANLPSVDPNEHYTSYFTADEPQMLAN